MKLLLTIILYFTFTSLTFGIDYNVLGFNKYKKGKYKEANKLFIKSTKQNPKNLYGWYNLARTTYILTKKQKINDLCNMEKNPEYSILYYLTKASEINSKRVLELLKRDEPQFNKYKEKESFKKWKKSLNTNKTINFFIKNKWIPHINKFPYKNYSFDTNGDFTEHGISSKEKIGTWKFKNDKIIIKFKNSKKEIYNLKKKNMYFDMGKKYFSTFMIEPSKNNNLPIFLLGPKYQDCGEYNF